MALGNLAAHAFAVAHGAGAALIVAAVLYGAGLALVPGRSSLTHGETPAIIAAAVYVLICWIGFEHHVPLARSAGTFSAFALAAGLLRRRSVVREFRLHVGWPTAGWVLAFIGFYVLVYILITPPVDARFLPIAWLGNIDVMTYVRYTQHVLLARPWNVADIDYLDYVYQQTPAVFFLHGAESLLFRQNALEAAMPTLLACAACLGVVIGRATRQVFALSRGAAVVVSAVLLASPFFRYIAAEFYLSTLMSLPLVVYAVWQTATASTSRWFDTGAMVRNAAVYVLLLYLYSPLLLIAVGAQLATGVLLGVARATSDAHADVRAVAGTALRHAAGVLMPFAVVIVVLIERVRWSLNELGALSRPGVAGWPMAIISPFAILGIPGNVGEVACSDCFGSHSVAITVLVLGGLGALLLALFWVGRRRFTPAERALVATAGGAMLAYPAYYLLAGPSYQQWKFASYTAMPFSFIVTAVAARLAVGSARNIRRVAAATGAALVAGNLLIHAQSDPPYMRLSGDLRNLSAIDADRSFSDVTIRMSESTGVYPTWIATYFLPSKRVHIVSDAFRPSEPLAYDAVTEHRPLLLDGVGCDGIGHDQVRDIAGIGCLIFAPPSLVLDQPYLFNQTYVFVDLAGLGPREPEGRWNVAQKVGITMQADIRRVSLFEPAFVNVKVNPYLPPGITHQRLELQWGSGRAARAVVDREMTISLPVARNDWTGTRMWTLPISIGLPDAVPPQWMYAPRGNVAAGPLGALFEEVSVTHVPTGTVMER
jgi:hypothetical protein